LGGKEVGGLLTVLKEKKHGDTERVQPALHVG
jgi:hypothetical protein